MDWVHGRASLMEMHSAPAKPSQEARNSRTRVCNGSQTICRLARAQSRAGPGQRSIAVGLSSGFLAQYRGPGGVQARKGLRGQKGHG